MSASNGFENDLLLLLFNNTNIANLGDATGVRGSTAAGSLFVSLHTADPGEAGDQSTNEVTGVTGYARVAVARTAGGWTISGAAPTQAANTATVTFGPVTVGSATATHFGVGVASSGATRLLDSGALTSSVALSVGNPSPAFAAGALVVTCD